MMTRHGLAGKLARIWKDFDEKLSWKYRELPPTALLKSLKLHRADVDNFELSRTEWFWRRRPRLVLGGFCSWALVCLAPVILFSLPIAFVWFGSLAPLFGLGLALAWILTVCVVIVTDNTRSVQWRREYESSADRLIRRRHKAS
jgi:hypothetical protein